MPKEIYNEGRVVGYSAWEVYVKNHLSEDPDTPPASEREWLASSLAMGASILLKFPIIDQPEGVSTIVDIPLPEGSKLCAANTVIANYFKGDASLIDGNAYFAKNITSYGQLLSNTSKLSPNGNVTTDEISAKVLPQTSLDWSSEDIDKLGNYMKIVDGLVIQPGEWQESTVKPPEKSLVMDPSQRPVLRFQVLGAITQSFWLLLTGFSLRAVVVGESGLDTSTDTQSPQDGDYLGPATYPWANKITFSVPSSAIAYFNKNKYERSINDGDTKIVDDSSIIDMRDIDYEEYYKNNPNCKIPLDIKSLSSLGQGGAILTIYQRDEAFPPSLYGTYVDKDNIGQTYLYPIDTTAPGTIKVFTGNQGPQLSKQYEASNPENLGLHRDKYYIFFENIDDKQLPVAKSIVRKSSVTINKTNYATYILENETGNLGITRSIALSKDYTNGHTDLDTSGIKGTITGENITWDMLLAALGNNKSIDSIGATLRDLKNTIDNAKDGSYSITIKNGKVSLDSAAQLPNFFMYNFDLSIAGYDSDHDDTSPAIYRAGKLSVFGWLPNSSISNWVCGVGNLQLIEKFSIRQVDGSSWYQTFRVTGSNFSEFYNRFVQRGHNLLRINMPNTTAYTNKEYNLADAGRPTSSNLWTGYLNSTGFGIVNCKNSGGTSEASSQSFVCTFQGFNSSTGDEPISHFKNGGTW